MKKIVAFIGIILFLSCDPSTLQTILNQSLSTTDIANGLKEALNKGSQSASNTLSIRDGFYKSAYKILLPEEARVVTDKLKIIPGFSNVEEVILEKINRAAEDAAQKAAPIFIQAIKAMTIPDALDILNGEKNAATQYLNRTTRQALYNEFQPVVLNSLNTFKAVDYWEDAVNKYNKLPFVQDVNPRLDDHVTEMALRALFDLVEKKEYKIRTDIKERTSDLLRRVFAQQD